MTMIPKTIHYCWFGHNPLPRSARKCIASWRKYLPDYEIREWNENNFDVNVVPYTAQAYTLGKYAFVSDYARFWILYREGGLYFDTDVEVIRPLDDLIAQGVFMGIEQSAHLVGVNPGLGLAAEPYHPFFREVLEHYATLVFTDAAGVPLPGTVVSHTTDCLRPHGWVAENRYQQVAGLHIYPNDYFNPLDDATGRLIITPNTRSVHWYAKTWVPHYGPVRRWVTRRVHRLFGVGSLTWLKRFIRI
ncbi:glycosyltransferase family 32 protein [Bacteroides sp. AN502(2024)]|uniref:glycosyltransferase family 32 protein n=1 Tax=Bacteroides sp. AN502(2024) TaxID=3160599 RepID=UPI003514E8A0